MTSLKPEHLKVTKIVNHSARAFGVIALIVFASNVANAQSRAASVGARKIAISTVSSAPIAKAPSVGFTCAARDILERFPNGVTFQVTNFDQLETTAKYETARQILSATLKRVEVLNQDRTAIFPVGGVLGISGEAKILISKEALKVGEVGTMMLINQSTRESVVYQCQKIVPTAVAGQ